MRLIAVILFLAITAIAQPALADVPSQCAGMSNQSSPAPNHLPPGVKWDGRSPQTKCYESLPFEIGPNNGAVLERPMLPNTTIQTRALLRGKNLGWTDVRYKVTVTAEGSQLNASRETANTNCMQATCIALSITMPSRVTAGDIELFLPKGGNQKFHFVTTPRKPAVITIPGSGCVVGPNLPPCP